MTEPVLNNAFETDQMRVAAAAGLAIIDAPPIEVTPIHRGNRKQTAIARFERREPVVVQTASAQSQLQTEAALLEQIRQRTAVPVPQVLATGTRGDTAYLLTSYVAGQDLHKQFTTLTSASQRTLAAWFGRALAHLHDAFSFDGYGQLTVSDKTLSADTAEWEPWFREFADQALKDLPAAFDPVRNELAGLFNDASIDSSTESRLFPWDFRPGNALIVDESVTAVVDWEAPLAAPPALAVAKSQYLMSDWYVDDPEPLRTAFKNGYTDIRTYPTIRPVHRAAAIAASAVDSTGVVTNPHYPPLNKHEAIEFHLNALETVLDDT